MEHFHFLCRADCKAQKSQEPWVIITPCFCHRATPVPFGPNSNTCSQHCDIHWFLSACLMTWLLWCFCGQLREEPLAPSCRGPSTSNQESTHFTHPAAHTRKPLRGCRSQFPFQMEKQYEQKKKQTMISNVIITLSTTTSTHRLTTPTFNHPHYTPCTQSTPYRIRIIITPTHQYTVINTWQLIN